VRRKCLRLNRQLYRPQSMRAESVWSPFQSQKGGLFCRGGPAGRCSRRVSHAGFVRTGFSREGDGSGPARTLAERGGGWRQPAPGRTAGLSKELGPWWRRLPNSRWFQKAQDWDTGGWLLAKRNYRKRLASRRRQIWGVAHGRAHLFARLSCAGNSWVRTKSWNARRAGGKISGTAKPVLPGRMSVKKKPAGGALGPFMWWVGGLSSSDFLTNWGIIDPFNSLLPIFIAGDPPNCG